MKYIAFCLTFFASSSFAGEGNVPASEVAIGGIAVGDSPARVVRKLGQPARISRTTDFLDLQYDYANMRVAFSDDVVAGLFSDKPNACTPKGLCPGDHLDKMRALYGEALMTDRSDGRYFEYYGNELYCWLKVSATGSVVGSIGVACQP